MKSPPLLTATPSGDLLELHPTGAWTAANAARLEALSSSIAGELDAAKAVKLDMTGVLQLDTIGGWLLEKISRRSAASGHPAAVVGFADRYAGLIEELHHVNRRPPAASPALNPIVAKLNDVGRDTIGAREDVAVFLQMLGSLFLALVGVLRRPRSLRLTSPVYQLYKVGWLAIPIMVLITFLIGAIIAQQGFFHFRKFGAESYVVDMVGILVLRELGVLIVAIMVAGRSGSAYTAELGSMKMREEIDALSHHGARSRRGADSAAYHRVDLRVADPEFHRIDGRALWRWPGGAVLWRHGPGDLYRAPARGRLGHNLQGRHHQGAVHGAGDRRLSPAAKGLRVKGSAESLGRQTTTSVVKSIFLVIVLDGLFAVFFASIGCDDAGGGSAVCDQCSGPRGRLRPACCDRPALARRPRGARSRGWWAHQAAARRY